MFAADIYLECMCKILVPGPYVPDNAVPWTLVPDWKSGVTERLKWKTDVLQGDTGVEQRKRLRITPRRDIEASYLIYRTTRRFYENLLNGPGAGYFRVPCWWEKTNLTAAMAVGDTYLACTPTNMELQRGDTLMLLSGPFTYELLVVEDVGTNGIDLQNTAANAWPIGTPVYLTRRCVLTGAQKAQRRSDDVAEVTLTFETREPNPWTAIVPGTNIGAPVLMQREDFREDTTSEYTRMLAMFDNDTGFPVQRDQAGQAFRHYQVVFTALNRADAAALRGMLYFMAGRLNYFYYATNNVDVVLLADIAATDTTIQIQNQGYAEYGGPANIGRSIIAFSFGPDTTPVLVTVASAELYEAGYEILTLTGEIGTAIPMASVQRASFVQLYRQDQDEVELQHLTDSAGATVVKTTFISAQEARSATDYSVAFTQGYTGDNQGI
jgi:hypothetical protein